jgi:hypothetical protein
MKRMAKRIRNPFMTRDEPTVVSQINLENIRFGHGSLTRPSAAASPKGARDLSQMRAPPNGIFLRHNTSRSDLGFHLNVRLDRPIPSLF